MSGSQVAYHLRVNKYIDRQLFVEALRLVDRFRRLSDFGYISMAGPYLEDCRVVHQATRISRMRSFDSEDMVIARQNVNRPFGFINLSKAASSEIVEQFDAVRKELVGEDGNVIVWLDYTDPKSRQEQLQEVRILVSKLISGDVLRVTMNAHRSTVGEDSVFRQVLKDRERARNERECGTGESGQEEEGEAETLADWRYKRLLDQLGECFPPDRRKPDYLRNDEEFCRTILRAIKLSVVKAIEPRKELFAQPVLSTAYIDTHRMTTLTCVILEQSQVSEFEAATDWARYPHRPGDDWDDFVEVMVPNLSVQERQTIHGTLANGGAFGEECPPFIEAGDLDQYQRHYNRYPTFAPLDIM